MSNSPIRSTRGFTLIELMVVISIISLLIAILLPALSAARNTARTTLCASQLRQIQIGLINYASDGDGRLPYSKFGLANAGNPGTWHWAGKLVEEGYITDKRSFWCASRDEGWTSQILNVNTNIAQNVRWAYTGYSANHWGAMPRSQYEPTNKPVHLDDARIPGSSLLVLTEGFAPSHLSTGRDGFYIIEPGSTGQALFSHQTVTNTTFLDGHGQSLRTKDDLGFDPETGLWASDITTTREQSPWFYRIYTWLQ